MSFCALYALHSCSLTFNYFLVIIILPLAKGIKNLRRFWFAIFCKRHCYYYCFLVCVISITYDALLVVVLRKAQFIIYQIFFAFKFNLFGYQVHSFPCKSKFTHIHSHFQLILFKNFIFLAISNRLN